VAGLLTDSGNSTVKINRHSLCFTLIILSEIVHAKHSPYRVQSGALLPLNTRQKGKPPTSNVHDYFDRWSDDGTLERMHHALYIKCREADERAASPTAAVIDSQSVKTAEKWGPRSIRTAMTPAKRSKARSATYWSTRPA
jgi:hypothetical protein